MREQLVGAPVALVMLLMCGCVTMQLTPTGAARAASGDDTLHNPSDYHPREGSDAPYRLQVDLGAAGDVAFVSAVQATDTRAAPHTGSVGASTSAPLLVLDTAAAGAGATPAGAAAYRPLFGWAVTNVAGCAPAGAGQRQCAARVVVSTAPLNGSTPGVGGASAAAAVVWDSGVVAGDTSLLRGAPPLRPFARYYWAVQAFMAPAGATGGPCTCASPWSQSAALVTGGLRQEDWPTPIAAAATGDDTGPRFMFMRREVTLAAGRAVEAAYGFATAAVVPHLLGAVKVVVNGRVVAVGPGRPDLGAAPPPSFAPGGYVPNATSLTQPVLAVEATAAAQRLNGSLALGLQCYTSGGAAAVLMLIYDDGSQQLVTTAQPQQWQAMDATHVFNPTNHTASAYAQPQEWTDAAQWPAGWDMPGFSGAWAAAQAAKAFAQPLHVLRTGALRIGSATAALTRTGYGSWFADFGRELQGGVSLSVDLRGVAALPGGARRTAVVRMAEELAAPRAILWPMRTGNTFQSVFSLKDGAANTLTQHEYDEWRYGSVTLPWLGQQCAEAAEGAALTLACGQQPGNGPVITAVQFASYGTPTGVCTFATPTANTFRASQCSAAASTSIVQQLCVGKARCTLTPGNDLFGGDPCHLTEKRLAVAVSCGNASAPAALASAVPPVSLSAWTVAYPWHGVDAANYSRAHAAFNSSSDALNAVWDLCAYTMRASALDTYTDSNTRERLPYEADGLIQGLGHYHLTPYHAWQRHSLHSNFVDPTWPTEWVIISVLQAALDWQWSGDASTALALYNGLRRRTMLDFVDGDGVVDFTGRARVFDAFGHTFHDVIDWPQVTRDGYVMSNRSTVVQSYAQHAMDALADVAALVNATDAQLLRAAAARVRQALQTQFWNASTGTYCDTVCAEDAHSALHSNMFPLWLGAVPEARVPAVWAAVQRSGMLCSVYGAMAALGALYANGDDHGNAALRLLTSTSASSWLHMVAQGATMTMEAWYPAQKPNLSWSHPWAASPLYWLAAGFMGVRATAPRFAAFEVRPQVGDVAHASLTLPTAAGDVAVAVRQQAAEAASFEVTLTVPANCEARVCLPALGNASLAVRVDGQAVQGVADGDYVCVDGVASLPAGHAHTLTRPA